MEDLTKYKHKINITVRFSDLDAMGHVNNSTYLTYLEEARIAYFNTVLKTPKDRLAFGAVIVRIEIDYLKQVKFGENLEIYTRCSDIGHKSAELKHLIVLVNEKDKAIAAASVTKLVSFDYKEKISVPIPGKIKAIIQDFEKS